MPSPPDTLWAEGSGRELALGAAHALLSLKDVPNMEEIVRQAVDAAIIYDSTCGGTAWLEELSAESR